MAISPLYIPLPGMEIYLAESFFHGQLDRPRRLHNHPAYELVCIETDGGMTFRIIPPLLEHLAADAPPEKVTSLLFSFTAPPSNDICQTLHKVVNEPITFSDDFQGQLRIRNVKRLVQNSLQWGAYEQITAELRLLFICITRKLNSVCGSVSPHRQTLDNKRLAILEDYFNIGLKDPDCSKAQLAALLRVSERQLTRILEQTYRSTFSDLLMRSRMNIANAMAAEGSKSAEEIAQAVGYRSAESLKRAYRTHFGVALKIQNRT